MNIYIYILITATPATRRPGTVVRPPVLRHLAVAASRKRSPWGLLIARSPRVPPPPHTLPPPQGPWGPSGPMGPHPPPVPQKEVFRFLLTSVAVGEDDPHAEEYLGLTMWINCPKLQISFILVGVSQNKISVDHEMLHFQSF